MAAYPIVTPVDLERVRRAARTLARTLDFGAAAAECVVLATLELATNLLRYAHEGMMCLDVVQGSAGMGIRVQSVDQGPGIADVAQALTDGYSTGTGLGSGLPAVRRLMDTFALTTTPAGTRVVACKWRA